MRTARLSPVHRHDGDRALLGFDIASDPRHQGQAPRGFTTAEQAKAADDESGFAPAVMIAPDSGARAGLNFRRSRRVCYVRVRAAA